jgi:hypothetical protein
VITASPGKGFAVCGSRRSQLLNYTADLYSPAGKVEWSLTIPVTAGQDQWPVQVPGANREAGTYTLAVRGVTAAGKAKSVVRHFN